MLIGHRDITPSSSSRSPQTKSGTRKSIAKWTHQHLSPAGFSAWQAEQGAKGGRIGGKVSKGGGRPSNAEALLPEVLRLKGMGYSNRDIAEDLGIGSASVSRYLSNISPK